MKKAPLRSFAVVATLAALCLAGCAATDDAGPWPETVVSVDRLRSVKPMQMRLAYPIKEERPKGTVVLRLHLLEDGSVRRAAIMQSSGNGRLDEAALLAAREARFTPYAPGGSPVQATVVAPFHVR